jgi:hypothetical protein
MNSFGPEFNETLARSLGRWLSAHAATVTRMCVTDARPQFVPLELPCPLLTQLQELRIRRCQLQEPGSSSTDTAHWQQQQHLTAHEDPSSSSSSTRIGQPSLACLTSLTALSLENVKYGLSDAVTGLSALTGLQQLLLGPLQLPPIDTPQTQEGKTQLPRPMIELLRLTHENRRQQQLWPNVVTSLYQLSQLTQLELHNQPVPLLAPRLFAHMQQLQELKLLGARVNGPGVLQDLPASLTKLELTWRGSRRLSSSTVPALACLTSLQHLVLEAHESGGIDPSLISSMQQLRVLSLRGAMFRDSQQHGDQAAAAAAPLCRLLDALSQLSKLESLAIISTSQGEVQALPAHDTAKYSALLSASAHLTQLQLCWEGEGSWLLPEDCWQHVFAAGVQRPQLKELWVGIPQRVLEDQVLDDLAEAIVAGACVGPGDVDRLAQCCPALEYLSVPGMVQVEEHLDPLTALTALTGLFVGGEAVSDDAISSALAPLTGLQRLQIYQAPDMTDQGLLALSALRQLTTLGASNCGISEALWDDGGYDRSRFATKVRICRAFLTVSGQVCMFVAVTELQQPYVEWQKQLHGQRIELVCGCRTAVGLHDKHLDSLASRRQKHNPAHALSHARRQAEPD